MEWDHRGGAEENMTDRKKGGGGVKAGHVGDKQDQSGVKVRKAGLMAYIMGQIKGKGQ